MPLTEIKIADTKLRQITLAIGFMGVIAFGFYTFNLLSNTFAVILDILKPFLIALILAYLFAPVVIMLQNKLKLGRIMGTLVLYLIIFLIFFLLIAIIVPAIISQFISLFELIKDALPKLISKISQSKYLQFDKNFLQFLQSKIQEIDINFEKIINNILPILKKIFTGGFEAFGGAAKELLSGIGLIIDFFSFLIFIGIIHFYYILDWEKIRPLVKKMIPVQYREKTFDLLDKMDNAIGGFMRGQISVSAIVGTMYALGLFIIGSLGFPSLRNYSILIGTISGIAGFIPYLGPIIGAAPAVLIVLFTTDVTWTMTTMALIAIGCLFATIQGIEGFVLQPRIIGKGAGLHPLIVMLSLLTGAQFGITGMITAVPMASIIRVIVREFYWLPLEQKEAELK